MEPTASARGGVILAVIAGAVSGAVLATITTVMLQDRAVPASLEAEPAARPSPELGDLRTSIDDLRQQIARLAQFEPAAAKAASSASPSALGPGAPATQAEVASVAEAVQRLEQRVQAALPPHIPPPGAEDATKREVLRPFVEKKKDLPTESYLYLTEAELLAAYGTPNAITTLPNGHTAWLYVVDFGDANKPTRAFNFEFTGGRVTDYTRQ
jgi:hypothetical protein